MESLEPGVDESGAVRAKLADLGLDSMVDIHTHFMPTQVMDKVWDFFDRVGARTGLDWPINYRSDQEHRLALLRSFGVSAFTSMIYPHKPDMAAWLNAWAADFAASTPDCLHTATFHPERSAADYVPAAIEGGARIFKSHVQVGDFDPNDPLLDPVWGTLSEAGMPVVIHCGDGPSRGRFTGPDGARTLMSRFPDLVLVIAHMGLPDYADFLDLAQAHAGVHLDTTMVFTDFTEVMAPFPVELCPRLLDVGDKILFGSDFPNIPYSYLHAVDAVIDLGLGDDWVRGVLAGNARRLMGL